MSSTSSINTSTGCNHSGVNSDLVHDIMIQLEERKLLQHHSSKRRTGILKGSKSRSTSVLQALRKNRLKKAKKPKKSTSLSLLCGVSRSKTLENLQKSGNILKSRATENCTSTPGTENADLKKKSMEVLCTVQGSKPGLDCNVSPIYQPTNRADMQSEPPVHNVLKEPQCKITLRSAVKYRGVDPVPSGSTKRVSIRNSPVNIRTPHHKRSKEDKEGLMRLDAGHTPRLIRKKEEYEERLI